MAAHTTHSRVGQLTLWRNTAIRLGIKADEYIRNRDAGRYWCKVHRGWVPSIQMNRSLTACEDCTKLK